MKLIRFLTLFLIISLLLNPFSYAFELQQFTILDLDGGQGSDRLYTGQENDSILNDLYNPQELNKYSFELRNPYQYVDEHGKFGVAFYGSGDISAGGAGASGGLGTLYTISWEYGLQVTYLGTTLKGLSVGTPGGGLAANIEFLPKANKVSDVIGKSQTRGFAYSRGVGGGPFYSSQSFGIQVIGGAGAQIYDYESTTYIFPYYFQIGAGNLFSFQPSYALFYSPYIPTSQNINLAQNVGGCDPSIQSCQQPQSSYGGGNNNYGGGSGGNGRGGGGCGVTVSCPRDPGCGMIMSCT